MRNGMPRGRASRLSSSTSIISITSGFGGDPVELGRHDEIVFVQALYLLGAQRHRGIAPAKADVGVMAFGFGERSGLLNKAQRLSEILEPVSPLDAARLVEQR